MSFVPTTLIGILAIVAFVLVVIPFIVASFLRNVEAGTIRLVSWLAGGTVGRNRISGSNFSSSSCSFLPSGSVSVAPAVAWASLIEIPSSKKERANHSPVACTVPGAT